LFDSKKRSSHSTEALITENNKILFCFKEEKKQHYFFKKVAVKIGEKSEKYVEIISSDQIDSSSKILIKGVLISLTKKNKVALDKWKGYILKSKLFSRNCSRSYMVLY
jgi:hypothetical protein